MQKKNENKKNKKVVVVAAMALLLALVGISGGETYAKYASKQTDDASATVAKWGYVVSANASELFGKQYGTVSKPTNIDNVNGVNVVSSTEDKVLAPGTTGSMTMSVNGDAEVLSKITTSLSVTDILLKASNANSETIEYYPLVWKLEVTGQYDDLSDPNDTPFSLADTISDLRGADVQNQINAKVEYLNDTLKRIEANFSVSYSITLSWEWKFENNGLNNAASDKEDTIFGGFADDPNATTYEYRNGDSVVTWTKENGTNFTAEVNGSVTVSQIQDSVQP